MKITLTTLLSIFVLQSFAQNNFQPGSIEKISGETVNGYIDYRAWDRNPRSIRFRESEDGAISNFTVADIAAFQVSGKERYRRAVVVKDMRPVEVHLVTSTTLDSTATDTAFLRVVAEGKKLNLFELVDAKTHFYISDSTGSYQELIYKVHSMGWQSMGWQQQVYHTFRDQLKQYSNDSKVLRRLADAEYEEVQLLKIVNLINGVDAPKMTGRTKTHGAKTVFFVEGGVNFATLKTTGLQKLEGMKYTSSTSPTFGVGVDIVSNRNLGLLALRFEAIYSSADFEGRSKLNQAGKELEREYAFKMTNITPSASLLVSPIRKPGYRVYVGLGIAYNFSSYSGNEFKEVNLTDDYETVFEDYLSMENSWLSLPVQAGANFGKFDIIVSSSILGNFERIIALKAKYSAIGVKAAYRF